MEKVVIQFIGGPTDGGTAFPMIPQLVMVQNVMRFSSIFEVIPWSTHDSAIPSVGRQILEEITC